MGLRTLSFCLVLVLCIGFCMGEPGDIDEPIVLTPGDTYVGTTVGRDIVNSACSFLGDFTAPAVYFTIESPPEYYLTLTTCGDETNFDTTLLTFAEYVGYGFYCQNVEDAAPCNNYGGVSLELRNGEEQLSTLEDFTFLVAVTGTAGASGDFSLTLNADIPNETWDECFEALAILGPQSFMGRIFSDGSGTPMCDIDSQTSVAWYRYETMAAVNGVGEMNTRRVTVTTCSEDTDFDTILFLGGEMLDCDTVQCSEISDNFCSDDMDGTALGSTLIFDTENTGSALIGITGKGSSSGVYRLTITEEVDEVQDPCLSMVCGEQCDTPLLLPVGESYAYISPTTPQAEADICGVISPDDYVIWYHLNSPLDTTVTISTCASLFDQVDTVIAVVDACDSLSCIAFNDDSPCPFGVGSSAVAFNAVAHQDYIVVVSTYDHAIGSVEILVEVDLEE